MIRGSLFLISITTFIATPGLAEIARIKASSGAALVQRGSNHLPAAVGQELLASDTLVTGKDGRISLTFIDNTRFAVGPNSRVVVSKFEYDRTRQQGSFITQVDRGSLAVVSGKIAKSGRDAMKVQTPNSVLGVRGTRFIVEMPK